MNNDPTIYFSNGMNVVKVIELKSNKTESYNNHKMNGGGVNEGMRLHKLKNKFLPIIENLNTDQLEFISYLTDSYRGFMLKHAKNINMSVYEADQLLELSVYQECVVNETLSRDIENQKSMKEIEKA